MISIDMAFKKINRANFVPDELKDRAHIDAPLPIGFGQTISQPSTVAYMLEWLEPEIGDKILDVGSGSGWTTALLSELVGPKGSVYAVERVPELVTFGMQNCANLGIANVKFFQAGKHYGLPEYAPYDKILVSAAAETLPSELLDQLRVKSKLVVPVSTDILEVTKTTKDDYDIQKHAGFVFVPLEPTSHWNR